MPTKQPILDEIHKVREQMLADAGGTLAGLIAKMQAEQAKSGRKIYKSRKADTIVSHPELKASPE